MSRVQSKHISTITLLTIAPDLLKPVAVSRFWSVIRTRADTVGKQTGLRVMLLVFVKHDMAMLTIGAVNIVDHLRYLQSLGIVLPDFFM